MTQRRIITQLLVLTLAVPFLTCGQKQADQKQNYAAQSDLQEIRATIEQINKKMEKAALANDFATQLFYFTDDILIDHPLEPPIRGKAAIQERQSRGRREGVQYRSFSGTTEDLWACGERVYERGTWGMSFTTNTMKRPFAAYGSYFQIWTKRGGDTYRIEYLIFTLDMNPYETGK